MKLIQIYLSSTSFGFFDFRHKNWKKKFMMAMHRYDFYLPYYNCNKITFKYIDPLLEISNEAKIVDSDIDNMNNSDYIVVYLPKKLTIGTLMELTYGVIKYGSDKIILIDKTKIHRNHPWIKYWINSDNIADNEYHAAHILSQYISDKVSKIWKEEF